MNKTKVLHLEMEISNSKHVRIAKTYKLLCALGVKNKYWEVLGAL